MRVFLAAVPLVLLAGLSAGCFDLKGDDQAFCQGLKCGVFVSSSMGDDATADGTRDKPYSTLAQAIGNANGALNVTVIACGETFVESVSIGKDTIVYGGADCKNGWVYKPETPTTIVGPADAIPLRISGEASVVLYDMAVRAVDATVAGGSSVGVVVDATANLELNRCSIEAGSGMAGEDAVPEDGPAPDGLVGADGAAACTADTGKVEGAKGPVSECDGPASKGGDGAAGDAKDTFDMDGNLTKTASLAGTPANGDGAGGPSESDSSACGPGHVGTGGADGADGSAGKSLGKLDAGKGFIGAAGTKGKSGIPGQGGGGGGGAKGGVGATMCSSDKSKGGASGGSGGSGGCAGHGGGAGGAGGASIGLVSLGGVLTFTDVKIKTGHGGDGGSGASGQLGGLGALGGNGGIVSAAATDLHPACGGGAGGKGGKGGDGGGGRGGHSIGIAYLKTAPPATGVTVTLGGDPGKGGKGPGASGQAEDGVKVETEAF